LVLFGPGQQFVFVLMPVPDPEPVAVLEPVLEPVPLPEPLPVVEPWQGDPLPDASWEPSEG
jgi:hypothetical protein